MSTSTNQRASPANSGLSVSMRQGLRVGERGFSIACRCGESSVIRTSTTTKNPGRLFHCCRNGSETKNHLFKWADESMIEEIDNMKDALRSSSKEIELMEDNIQGYEKKYEELKSRVLGYGKGVSEMERELRFLKTILICGVVLIACYCCICA